LWDLRTARNLLTLGEHTNDVNCVAFSPDGKSLASASDDKTIKLWNVIGVVPPPLESVPTEKFPPLVTAIVSFVEPSGNNLLDGNETATIRLDFSNAGKGPAYNLTAKLDMSGDIKGITADKQKTIATLEPEHKDAMEFKISADRSVVNGQVKFDFILTEGKGYDPPPVSITINTQVFRAPELVFVETGIRDDPSENSMGNGNRIIENNETIEATCLVQNRGQGVASGVKAKILFDNRNILSIDSSAALGTLQPGESKSLSFSFTVNSRYSGPPQLPISLELSESYGNYGGIFPLGLEMRKVTLAASEVKVEGTYAEEVVIPSAPSLVSDVDKDIPVGQPNPDAIAVVIGNANYRHFVPTTPNVDFAVNDAQSFREYLIRLFGLKEGNIVLLVNATKGQIEDAFGGANSIQGSRLYNMCKPGKSDVFVFYSGHGAPGLKDQQGYLVPIDANPSNIETAGYPLEQLFRNLSQLESRSTMVVTDACFSGMSQTGALFTGVSPVGIRVQPQAAIPNSVVITAGTESQFATWNYEQKHGMLTYFLLRGLRGAADEDGDGQVQVSELEAFLTDRSDGVPYASRNSPAGQEQIPQIFGQDKSKVIVEVK
ncbi:caspase family protein, partial [bacterium]|nr:caspase family protein [bacterium]